jgi:hypothetical protein
MGLVLIVAEDPEALDRVRSRLVQRDPSDLLRIASNRRTRQRKAAQPGAGATRDGHNA